jgi:hypothetical protein
MYDVMMDLETTGTQPERTGILQVAAIKFDYETGAIGTDMFNRAVLLAPDRLWDFHTIKWWQEDTTRREHLNMLMRTGQPAATVFQDLTNWLGLSDRPFRMWAKPTSFEHPFLSSHYKQLGMECPFHYRYCVDVNSFISGLQGSSDFNREAVESQVPFEGMPHNALFDALHDVRIVMKAKELYAK